MFRSGFKEISSVERVTQNIKGEVEEVRRTPGWERVRIQIDSGAIDTVGPKEIAVAFKMRETEMSKREDLGTWHLTGAVLRTTGIKRSRVTPMTEKV